MDIFLRNLISHIEGAAHGADEPFPAQISGVDMVGILRAVYSCTDVQITILQFGTQVFLLNTGQVDCHFKALFGFPDIGIHQSGGVAASKRGIHDLIKEISCELIRCVHYNFSFRGWRLFALQSFVVPQLYRLFLALSTREC